MRPPGEKQALKTVVERLAGLLGLAPSDGEVRTFSPPEVDAVVDIAGLTFVIEWKSSGAAASVSTGAARARQVATAVGPRAIPLVAVPYMGEVGRDRCKEADVAWLDLSGNARIFAPGIRVLIDGKPNRYKRRGRPASAFAPKSARIARWLLIHHDKAATQREIAQATDMDEGFTSRIVSKLEEDGLVVRDADGGLRAQNPGLLLDAWREDYDFSKHRVHRGHVAARSGDALLHGLAAELLDREIRYAATGLAAAWLLNRFAGFRIATFYLLDAVSADDLESLGFREDTRGANVWIVEPNDEGVVHGATEQDGVSCVHPVQAYLDLKAHPERAKEAADSLRAVLLKWSNG